MPNTTLSYSIVDSEPRIGGAGTFTVDVGAAITTYIPSVPISQQVTVTVTDLLTGETTVLTEGADYYTGAEGEIVVDQNLYNQGDQINFTLNTDFDAFYDDFSDLGVAPSGPAKRRDEQLKNMALELEARVTSLETGDIEVSLTETSITAGNVTYGPGAIQFTVASPLVVTDVAGTGFQVAIDNQALFEDAAVIGAINSQVSNYLDANPPASGVLTVTSRAPDGAGNINLVIADVTDAATVASTGSYTDLINKPTGLDEFSNASTGFIGTAEQAAIDAAIALKLDITALDGGTSGQVLKKLSNTNGDYAWGTDDGGAGSGATILDELDDVTITTAVANQVILHSGAGWINSALTAAIITDFDAAADARITASNPFDGAYSSLTGAPTAVSAFTNDSGYAVASSLATVATSGAYADITGTPDISGIATNATNIATNTSNISTNTTNIAGKFDEPAGTQTEGHVLTISTGTPTWAAPTGGTATKKLWSSYVSYVSGWDGYTFDPPSWPNGIQYIGDATGTNTWKQIETIAINSPVTFTSSTPTEVDFTVDETGTYRITSTALCATNGPADSVGAAITVHVNGSWKHGMSNTGYNTSNSLISGCDSHAQVSLDYVTNLTATDTLKLTYDKGSDAPEDNMVEASLIIERIN